MILHLIIKLPDQPLEDSVIVSSLLPLTTCQEYCKQLTEGKIPRKLKLLALAQYPQGYYIEGVYYSDYEEETIDAFDLFLKVLN